MLLAACLVLTAGLHLAVLAILLDLSPPDSPALEIPETVEIHFVELSDTVIDAGLETGSGTVVSTAEPPVEPAQSVQERQPDVSDQKNVPAPEPIAESVREPNPDPVQAPIPEPIVKPEPEQPSKQAPLPEVVSEPKPVIKPQPVIKPEPKIEPKPLVKPEPNSNKTLPASSSQLVRQSESRTDATLGAPKGQTAQAVAPRAPAGPVDPDRPRMISHVNYQGQPPKAQYPRASERRREQGRVVVRVLISPQGAVLEASVHKSSGFDRLDEAALQAARGARFKPYMENSIAYKALADIPFDFVL